MYFLKLFSFIIILLSNSKVVALNIYDITKITYNNNLGIQSHKKQMEITLLQSSITMSDIFPKISTEINLYNQFYDNLSSYGSSNYFGVLMEQEIFSGGKTFLKMSQNDLSIKKAYNKFNKSVNDTIYSAIESYQNIIFYRKKIKLKEENLKQYTLMLKNISIRHKHSSGMKEEIFYANAKLSTAKLDLLNDKIELQKHEEKFLVTVGIPVPLKIDTINLSKFKTFPNKKLFTNSSTIKSPEIINKKIDIEINNQNLILKKVELLPIVKIQLQHRKDIIISQNSIKSIGITVLLPLLNKGGSEYIEIALAKKILEAAKIDLKNTYDIINSESNNMWNMLIKYNKIINELRLIQNYYYNAIKSIEHKVINGTIPVTNLLDKQAQYNESTIQNIEAEELGYKLMFFSMHRHIGTLPIILNTIKNI